MDNLEKNNSYSEASFWKKLKKFALKAGKDVTKKALRLFYTLKQPETSLSAKTVIIGALSYFIVPTDAIPDFIPAAGYSDDLGILAAALLKVAKYITPEVKELAKKKMQDWFNDN